ncbi:hypothetical protein [Xanthomonas arboricola]|uniref:hypothetical protein n=1 Tax=Xanthomonas arboricola TaxID=56448 RepID=UPI001E474A82|nr:hypothetical protein [Xanthomonas arboricola]
MLVMAWRSRVVEPTTIGNVARHVNSHLPRRQFTAARACGIWVQPQRPGLIVRRDVLEFQVLLAARAVLSPRFFAAEAAALRVLR